MGKKLFRIRKPKLRITPKGIKITRPSARIGGKAGVNVSSRGVSASVRTKAGTISTGRPRSGRKKQKEREGQKMIEDDTPSTGKKRNLTIPILLIIVVLVSICCCGLLALPDSDEAASLMTPSPTTTQHPQPSPSSLPTDTPLPPIPTSPPTDTPLPASPTATQRSQPSPSPLPTDTPPPPIPTSPPTTNTPTIAVAPTMVPTIIPTPVPTALPSSPGYPSGVWLCPASTEGAKYVGSVQGDKFHYLGCRWAKKIEPGNRLCFASREAAIGFGYQSCGTCKP